MRTETAAHEAARLLRKTQPRYFARFLHVPEFGSPDEYAFFADFASGAIQASTKQKLLALEEISGVVSQVFPEQGRASQGRVELTLTDASNLGLQYIGAPVFHLGAAMTPSVPGPGQFIDFAETVLNIPASGTLEITTGDVIERVRYTGLDVPSQQVEVVARGVDGTTAANHAVDDEVVNGEQIRLGQRCELFAGYAGLDEDEFMSVEKLEVVDRRLHEDGAAFVIELSDIQRTLRREIFLTAAAPPNNILLTGDPFQLLLEILHSTGTGSNGIYDVLPAAWGLGIAQDFIDTAQIQFVSALVNAPDFSFDIRAPVTAKDWIEQEILQPTNTYPVTRSGKYSCRRFGGQR